MAPIEVHDDYYAVLEITQTASDDLIKTSYKRLARLRHPDKNAGNPRATAEFQLLQAAYSTLIDPTKRREYDYCHYPKARAKPHPRPSTNTNTNTNPPPSTAKTNSSTTDQDQAQIKRYQILIAALDKSIADLHSQKNRDERLQSDASLNLSRCRSALKRMQDEAKKDAAEEAARNGWFATFYSSETTEQKEARERRATERSTGRIVREAEEKRLEANLNDIKARIADLEYRITQARRQKASAVLSQDAAQERIKAAEARRQQEKEDEDARERMRARMEAEVKKQAEEARRQKEEAKRQEELRKKQDELRKKREEEERKEEEERRKQVEEARKKFEEEVRKREAETRQRQEEVRKTKEWEKFLEEVRKREEVRERTSYAKRHEGKEHWREREARLMRESVEKKNATQAADPSDSGMRSSTTSGRGRGKGGRGRGRGRGNPPGLPAGRSTSTAVCQHKGWWEKMPGGFRCEKCQRVMPRAAFKCRDCNITACAPCRNTLRGSETGANTENLS